MILLFFQNCLSPHQMPYIREICHDARVEKVYLITPRTDYEMRTEMGWSSSQLLQGTSIVFYLRPSNEELKRLLQNEGVIALFSGIHADKDVFRWFKLSLDFNVRRGIITEAPNIHLWKPIWLHCIRFFMLDYRYVKQIQYVFAFGELAVRYYHLWSGVWKVFPFSYCTDIEKCVASVKFFHCKSAKFLFVGTVDKNKNVRSVLKSSELLRKEHFSFDVIGDGAEKKILAEYVCEKQINNVAFHGRMTMKEVHNRMRDYDVLILPSRYDGWGAVVNEALQQGLYVICSDKCGAKDLLKNERCGVIFRSGSHTDLAKVMKDCCSHISEIRANRKFRQEWAERCISGKVIARYMVDCLSGEKVDVPWKC